VSKIVSHDLTNIRLVQADAMQVLEHMLAPGSAVEIWVFFADPWHKNRHHKRRLVNPGFAELAASRLAPGGTLRLATDWAHYARQMRDVLAGCGSMTNPYDAPLAAHFDDDDDPEIGFAPRFEGRIMTRFEQKAVALGRTIYDLELHRS
jgi:tRNA (guanine-N7-)-methyltransferase